MANGEGGGLFEEIVALLRHVVVGEKEAIDSTKRVEAAARESQKTITDFAKATLDIYKKMTPAELQKQIGVWKGAKRPIEDVIATLRDLGMTNEQIKASLIEAGWTTRQFNKALGETTVAGRKLDWSLQGIIKSVTWAAYRFMFALAIYMGFRKVIRWVNEAITESIRLFRELAKAYQTLATNVQMNTRIIGDSIGTLKEWQAWVQDTQRAWKTTSQAILDAANNALQANATLRMSAEELQDVIELGRAVAIMYSQYKDGQLDVAKGVEIVTDAIAGQEAAMLQLGFTLDDVVKYFNRVSESVDITKDEFRDLPDAMQASIIRAYIIAERFDDISKSAESAVHPVEAFTTTLDAAIAEQKANMGVFLAFFTKLPGIIELGALAIMDFAVKLAIRLNPSLQRTVALMSVLLYWAQRAVGVQNQLSEASQEGGQAAIDSATAWQRFKEAAERAKEEAAKARRIIDFTKEVMQNVKEAAEDAAEAFVNLGDAIADALIDFKRSWAEAGKEYAEDLAETHEDELKDIEDLNKRYDKRAADLRERAADRIADLRERAAEEEAEERNDLLLRLHQMEEDHQLDMKHLYEQYAMSYEEAARKRDAVTMRRLTREYKLERRQREEGYQLQRHQTIESWEARHKENQENYEEEIKEIEEDLAKELMALEEERREELDEIRENWIERRQELLDQYNQELADLKAALDRRLTEAIVEWAEQNDIPVAAVQAAVAEMARQYGLDATNLSNMVTAELQMLETLRQAWEEVRKAAAGEPTESVLARLGPGWGKIPQLEFAEGGMAIATKPTLVKVGEAGPELFTAIPLARGGSVIGGLGRGYIDAHLSIDGNQAGLWSADFERGVEHTVAKIFKEAFQE